jgi:transcriptional regulator with XRE-family HTH domain
LSNGIVLPLKQTPDPRLQALGRQLIEKRAAMGIRAAAAEIGVSPATLSRVERGYLPDLTTFAKICTWLKVDPAEVLGVSTERPAQQPRVSVHFRKDTTMTPAAAQALAQMVMAAFDAWLSE